MVVGDVPSIATGALLGSSFFCSPALAADAGRREELDAFDLLPAADLSLDQIDVRPGNVLMPVRNPHSLLTWRLRSRHRQIATWSS